MSRIVIFGGTGYSGGNIAREAINRGHEVVSYSRNIPTEPDAGVEYRTGSLTDAAVVEEAAKDADDLVVAVHAVDPEREPLLQFVPALVDAAKTHGARLSFVGGAGSSLVAEGGPRLLDTPEFLPDWKPEAIAHAAVLDALRASEGLDWFYVSPAGLCGAFAPGEDTGAYRTGGDVVVTKEDGSSEISGVDFARAHVDEIEQCNHVNRRFTVGH